MHTFERHAPQRPRTKRWWVAVLAAASGLGTGLAAADTTVRVLRVEISDVEKQYYADIVAEYEAQNPDVEVVFEYIANEAYKTRLPTLLQSNQRPDIFYSWGGEGLRDQVDAGFVRDLTEQMQDGWQELYPESAVRAFTLDDRIYGAPLYATVVGFWANTAMSGSPPANSTCCMRPSTKRSVSMTTPGRPGSRSALVQPTTGRTI